MKVIAPNDFKILHIKISEVIVCVEIFLNWWIDKCTSKNALYSKEDLNTRDKNGLNLDKYIFTSE